MHLASIRPAFLLATLTASLHVAVAPKFWKAAMPSSNRRIRRDGFASLVRPYLAAACLLLPLCLVVRPGYAQLVLMPGEFRENIPAAGKVLESSSPGNPDSVFEGAYVTAVAFNRADALTQNIRIYANSNDFRTATARGILFVDFCVPRPGLLGCDTVSDPGAPDVVAAITFSYGVVGAVSALGVGANAKLQVTASVIDLEKSSFVNFQSLADLSASNGTVKTLASLPVPIPDFDGATVVQPVTFNALLKRGRVYRFQLAAASTARGFFYPLSVADWGESNFYKASAQFPLQEGHVQLHNLTIRISNDSSDLADELDAMRGLITALQEQLGNLGNRIDALEANLQDEISALNQAVGDLARLTDVPGSLLMLPAGSSAPPGYTFIGTFDFAPNNGSRGRPAMMPVDMYRRNSP
jgi:hypothetical protein